MAGIPTYPFPPAAGTDVEVGDDDDGWNQQWTIIAHEAILMTENGSPYQEWKATFIDPPYDYALVPGFPGAVDSGGCLESANEPKLAKAAMHYCDASMSLLVGRQTSLGTLTAIADLINDEGLERMPGICCFDTPTSNDAYFGVDVSQD